MVLEHFHWYVVVDTACWKSHNVEKYEWQQEDLSDSSGMSVKFIIELRWVENSLYLALFIF